VTDEAIPSVGLHRTDDHRYYWNGDGPFTSVTTAIGMYDKSDALVGWAKKETAIFALAHLPILTAHLSHFTPDPFCPPCEADAKRRNPVGPYESGRLWVSSLPDRQRDAAADLGTNVHTVAEAIGRGEDPRIAPELLPYAEQYRRFLDDEDPQYRAIEYMGVNLTHGYAGTGDFIADINGWRYAIDIKTYTKTGKVPKTYYPTTGMQLAACAAFEFIGKPDDPTQYPVPEVERYAVLLLGQEDYRLIPYKVTDATFAAFLHCLDLHRWKHGEAKTIVGSAA
jgi:hypothetical protein